MSVISTPIFILCLLIIITVVVIAAVMFFRFNSSMKSLKNTINKIEGEKQSLIKNVELQKNHVVSETIEKLKIEEDKKKSDEKNRKIWQMSETVYKEKKRVDEENEKLSVEKEKLLNEKEKLEIEKKKFQDKNKKLWDQSIAIHKEKERIDILKKEIEEKHFNVTQSIKYALRIQRAILPAEDFFKQLLPDSFVLYKPKDIVSGDFYWVGEFNDKILFSVIDCTGHGVPGAFMSMLGSSMLNQALIEHEITKPSEILSYLSNAVQKYLHHSIEGSVVKDGMDLAVCCFDKQTHLMEFAAVHNPMYQIHENEMIQHKADILPIGEPFNEEFPGYVNNEIQIQSGDMVYLFSDGYSDQFGGPNKKKFMSKQLRELLTTNSQQPMTVQKEMLEITFENWKDKIEQFDDVTVMGVKFSF